MATLTLFLNTGRLSDTEALPLRYVGVSQVQTSMWGTDGLVCDRCSQLWSTHQWVLTAGRKEGVLDCSQRPRNAP